MWPGSEAPPPKPGTVSPSLHPLPILAAWRIGPHQVLGLSGSGAALMPRPHAAQARTLARFNANRDRDDLVVGEAHLPGWRQQRQRLVLRLLVRLARKEGAKARELKKRKRKKEKKKTQPYMSRGGFRTPFKLVQQSQLEEVALTRGLPPGRPRPRQGRIT